MAPFQKYMHSIVDQDSYRVIVVLWSDARPVMRHVPKVAMLISTNGTMGIKSVARSKKK